MARDIFSVLIPIAFGAAGVFIATRWFMKSMNADDDVSKTIPNPTGGWPYVVTEPTEQNMLLQSLLMRPSVNEELNYLYGSAPPVVSISQMTDYIVGTPVPFPIY